MWEKIIVLKIGPDRTGWSNRFNQEPGASLVLLKSPKPVKKRGWTRNFFKNGSILGSVFKTMEKKKWTTKCDKSTIKCDVRTAQCENRIIKREKKIKKTTKYDKRTVTYDVGTAQYKNGTVKCNVLLTWYSRFLTNGYLTPKKRGVQ